MMDQFTIIDNEYNYLLAFLSLKLEPLGSIWATARFPAPLNPREARDRPHAQAREAETLALAASATVSPKATMGVWGPYSPRFEKACFRKLLNAT